MKNLYLYLLLFLASSSYAQEAQEPIVLFQEDVQVGMYGAERYAFGFEEGDQMVFSFINIAHRPFKAIEIRNEKDHSLVLKFKRPYNVINKTIAIADTADYSFHFKNKGFFGRKVAFTLKRIPKPVVAPDTLRQIIYKDSIILDSIWTTLEQETIVYDTIPEELLQTEFTVGPAMDIQGSNRQCIELPMLEDNGYSYVAYWIGIGQNAINDYDAMVTKPPQRWLKAGIDQPLHAYAAGLQNLLPSPNNIDDFECFFLGKETQVANFSAKKGRHPDHSKKAATVGRLQHWEYLGLPLYYCMHNKNPISSVKVRVHLLGFKVTPRALTTEIEKLTIIEKVVKVPAGVKVSLIKQKK